MDAPLSGASGKSLIEFAAIRETANGDQATEIDSRRKSRDCKTSTITNCRSACSRARTGHSPCQQRRARPAIAKELELTEVTVRAWLKRFNNEGLDGLADLPRSGCPAMYTAEQVAEVIAGVLSDPQQLGQPFACWTLACFLR